jgi:parallel beta-helix repeat protein
VKKLLSILVALVLFALVLVVSFSLVTAVPVAAAGPAALNVVPFTLQTGGNGTATWDNTLFHSGSYSVGLSTGTIANSSYGAVNIPIAPILLQSLTADPSYWVYEPTVTTDRHPYVNIILDLDGNLATSDIDCLEGVESLAVAGGGQPPAATWTEMREAAGYYDGDQSMGVSGYTVSAPGTLAQWKTYMGTHYANAKVIRVQLMFGMWAEASIGPVYVDDVNINGITYYGRIQDAIDSATAGDTINVAAGAYTENINVNKALTLTGASSATVTVTAAINTASVFTVTANNVNISGFTATHTTMTGDEGYAGIKFDAGVKNCNIHDNRLTGNQYGILLIDPENTTTAGNNTFTSNNASGNGVSGIEMQHTYGNTFTGNTASSNKYGFKLDSADHNNFTDNIANSNVRGFFLAKGDGNGPDYNIFTTNTANLNTEYGFREDNGDHNTLTGNTFDHNVLAGLRLKEVLTNLMVNNNNITNSPIGIDIAAPVTNVTSWTVTHNNIVGNTIYGISNLGTGILNAECNWWGDASGPNDDANVINGSGGKISVNVDAKPWYATATTTPETQYVTVTESPDVRAYSDTIQGGIDAAVTGNTVSVAAGTYTEQINITKPLTLSGAGMSSTHIVSPTPASMTIYDQFGSKSPTSRYIVHRGTNIPVVRIAASNVSFSGFHVNLNDYTFWDVKGRYGVNYSRGVGILVDHVETVLGTPDVFTGITIQNNKVDGLKSGDRGDAIKVLGSATATVTGNYLYGGESGINVQAVDSPVVGQYYPTVTANSNTIYSGGPSNGPFGIGFWSGATGSADGNTIYNDPVNGGYALNVWGSRPVSFTSNTVTNVGGVVGGLGVQIVGTQLVGSPNIIFTNNTIKYQALAGAITYSATATITGNTIINCTDGFIVDWETSGAVVTMHSNSFTGITASHYAVDVGGPKGVMSDSTFWGTWGGPSTITVDATNNWWGSSSGPGPVGPGTGGKVTANVLYEPWTGETVLSVTPSTGTYGGTVSLSATLTSGGTGVSGKTISFTLSGSAVGSAITNGSGVATLTGVRLAGIGAGTHTGYIGASFAGDTGYSASSGTADLTVNQATTSLSLRSSRDTSTFGQWVTFSVTVKSTVIPRPGIPTGTVNFMDGATVLGPPVTLNSSGKAAFRISSLDAGTHSITASYSGDTNFAASTSAALPQVVQQRQPSTRLTSSGAPVYGQSVTFTATITSAAGTPSGTVQFMDNGTNLPDGLVTLSSGTAIYTTSALSAGRHSITAVYSGDPNFTSSNKTRWQVVRMAKTKTLVISSSSSSTYGAPVIFTATVNVPAPGAGTPSGTVTFKDGTTALGTESLSGGVATFNTSSLSPGVHRITAVYNGDDNFKSSKSIVRQVVT